MIMKNRLILLLLLISTVAWSSSCKKDDDNNALLTSGKWYYDFVDNLHNVGTHSCFNKEDYIEFKADGMFSASHLLGDGTYTLSDDGKSLTISLTANIRDEYNQWKGTIHLLQKNDLRMTIVAVREMNQEYGYEITLAHQRANPDCQRPK